MIDPDRAGLTRDEFLRRMHARKIGTGVHYTAVHMHPYYRDTFGYKPDDFPNARWIGERTVSLPLAPYMSEDDTTDVISAVKESIGA